MTDPIVLEGDWWFPDNPASKFPGKVTFEYQTGSVFELYIPNELKGIRIPDNPEVIVGRTHSGDAATLYLNYSSGGGYTPSRQTRKFHVGIVLLRALYDGQQPLTLDSLTVTYTNLSNWLRLAHPFKTESVESDSEITEQISYPKPRVIEVPVDHLDATINLHCLVTESFSGNLVKLQMTWEQYGYIEITPKNEQTLEWYFTQVYLLRNLLALMIGFPVHITGVSALSKKYSDKDFIDGETHEMPINIYFADLQHQQESSRLATEMLLALMHVESILSDMVNLWFEKQTLIKTLSDLAGGVLYRVHRLTEFEFLALMQALEGFHKTKFPNCTRKTKSGNKRNCYLEERLQELCDSVPHRFLLFCGKLQSDLKSFVQTRNYISHREKKAGDTVFEDNDLAEAVSDLASFIMALIFQELSVPEEEIIEALRRGNLLGARRIWWRRPSV